MIKQLPESTVGVLDKIAEHFGGLDFELSLQLYQNGNLVIYVNLIF